MSVKKQLSIANAVVRKAKEDRQKVFDEGRSDRWTKEKLFEVEGKYSNIAAEIRENILAAAKDELSTQVDKAKRLRNRPGNNIKATDSAGKLYHLEIAKMAMAGLSEDEAITKYPDIISGLADHEKEHLHVYEDVLLAHAKSNRVMAQDVIFKSLPPERKVAEVGVAKLKKQYDTAEMLSNHFEHDLKNVISGKTDIPSYDYVELLAEEPKKPQVNSEAIEQALQGTPYDSGIEEHK